MKLYNTLTRSKEEIKPKKAGEITLYSCGPTVYHYYHIGNLRNAVFNDLLKRVLQQLFKVNHVMNITDVGHLTSDGDGGEDKLQSRAAEEGKTASQVADYYTEAFKRDMDALNVIAPDKYVKATETIAQQIEIIRVLLEKEFAYQAEQAIYFDVSKLDDYGKLTGQNLKDKAVGAREEVVTDSNKRNPADFALWFFTVGRFEDHEMRWNSPWGEGFPGWHLECSAIVKSEFGQTVDIHTGGVDHIGTHHTNEIAQSEAAHGGKPLANHWMHIEFLLVGGQKMSKSLQNTYTLADITAKGFSPMALRLLYLQSHYRTQQNFTFEALEAANNLLSRIEAWADGMFQDVGGKLSKTDFNDHYKKIQESLWDDLNTPQAFVHINALMDLQDLPTEEQVTALDAILGLGLADRQDIGDQDKSLIRDREAARNQKDFGKSDEIRAKLKKNGIEIDDTDAGTRWRRVS